MNHNVSVKFAKIFFHEYFPLYSSVCVYVRMCMQMCMYVYICTYVSGCLEEQPSG